MTRDMDLSWKLSSIVYQTLRQPAKKICVRTVVNLSYRLVGETTLHHEEPPVVLLHGLLSRKSLWRGIGKTIFNITRRTVLTVDLRNHGTSPHTNSFKYDEMAEDMIQLLDKLEIKSATLVGHCIGGRTAMCVSLLAPNRVAGLVIVDASPISTPKEFYELLKLIESLRKVDFNNAKKVSKAREDAKEQLRQIITNDIVMTTVLSNIGVKGDRKIGWMFNLDHMSKYFLDMALFPKKLRHKEYSGPCLFIGGQTSEFILPDDLNLIRDIFPKAVIKFIPKTGHHLYSEDPKTFLEQTIAFINTTSY